MRMKGIKRWVILAGLFLVSFLENGTQRSFAIILNDLTTEFRVTTAFLGALFGVVFGASYILAFLTIPLLRRFSVRQLTIVGGILSSVGLVLSSISATASQFSAALSLYGMGYTLIISPTNSCPPYYFPDRFGLATGILLSGGSTGVMLLPLLFESLGSTYGWRGAVMILGGINAHLVVSGALLQPLKTTVEVEEDNQLPPRNVCGGHDGSMNLGFDDSEHVEDSIAGQTRKNMQDGSTSSAGKVDSYQKRDQSEMNNETSDIVGYAEGKGKSTTLGQGMQESGVPDETMKGLHQEVSEFRNETIPEPLPNPDHCNFEVQVEKRKEIIRVLQAPVRFFELNIFKDHPLLVVVCIQACLFGMSYSGWLLFVIPNAMAKGLSTSRAVQISVVGGVCSLLGRLGGGTFASKEYLKVEVWYYIINIVSAAAFCTNFIADSFWFLMALSVVYGIMQGAKTPVQFLFVMNAVGKDRYSTGVCMLYFCVGLSFPISGALFGAIFDATRSYDIAFCIIGLFDIMVANITIAPRLRSYCTRRLHSWTPQTQQD